MPTSTSVPKCPEQRREAAWPTRVSPDGRLILDQHGAPWLGVGDTAWSLIGQLRDAQIVLCLDNRAAKGVNLVLVSAPEAWYGDKAPANIDGVRHSPARRSGRSSTTRTGGDSTTPWTARRRGASRS
jgi:hypothetical protein